MQAWNSFPTIGIVRPAKLVLFATITALIAVSSGTCHAEDATDFRVFNDPSDGTPPGQRLHNHLMDRVTRAAAARLERLGEVKTSQQAAEYQARMRHWMIRRLGGFPERTPLNPRVTGRQSRQGYRIEKVIFESQPGHFVTAILYLPDSKPPFPGVLVPCGHSATGKARDLYQRTPIVLARHGMAALCYDPIDQGERHQLLGENGKPVIASSTAAHNQVGVGAVLVGRNTATYRVWDGTRAIDYLASRPEVDASKIGCTGISGGGTLTSYLMAIDDRIRAAAPGCYLTSFPRLLKTIGPQDAEQNIYGQLDRGLDHADYLNLRAPQATLVMAATRDFFDIKGTWQSYRQATRWYSTLGRHDALDIVEVDTEHGFPEPMREAAAQWMQRWLLGIDRPVHEGEFPVASEEELRCTPRGEVMLLEGARNVYDLNRQHEERLAKQRAARWSTDDLGERLRAVREITGIDSLEQLPELEATTAGTLDRDGYKIEKLILRRSRGVSMPALAFVPDAEPVSARIYLHQDGKDAEAAPGGEIESFVRAGELVLAVDVSGIGEMRPRQNHSYARQLRSIWRETTIAYLLGDSLLAIRAEDALAAARFLSRYESSGAPRDLHMTAVGRLGPPALHAAALQPEMFSRLELHRCLRSWRDVVHTPLSKNQWVNVVHGALAVYDLPDLVRSLGSRVRLVEPVDAKERVINE